jgi:sialate O-acetylesterase
VSSLTVITVIALGTMRHPTGRPGATGVSPTVATSAVSTRAATLRVARIFADGMVLQRGQPIVVWGWAAPAARVTVHIGAGALARTGSAVTSATGQWRATLAAMPAGGPHTLRVTSGGEQLQVRDVLVGDVWLASGQSNMEFPLARERNATREIANANDSLLREFKIPTGYAFTPQDSLVGGQWAPADRQHAGDMSAVAYFFARELRRSTRVPIGIINSTWGGSNIESWMSRDALGISEAQWRAVLAQQDRVRDSLQGALRSKLGGLPTVDSGQVAGRTAWSDAALNDADWASMPVPGYWEGAGYAGLDGVAWYRMSFSLSDAERSAGVTLSMTAIDDDDITWVNGQEVGRTTGYNVPRRYLLPASVLRSGVNVLAVRVSDGSGGGGINAPVALEFGNGARRALAGSWKFKVGSVSFRPDGQQINKIPSVLYNQMMHPIVPFPVAGVIWYQGESNANSSAQARAYETQFRAMITQWRSERRTGRAAAPVLPFLWVQLPNYGAPDAVPPRDAGWATLRESMDRALSLPRTGQAITIDIGEADDIHPRNKLDAGVRLARVARRIAYGEAIESSGPVYRTHTVRGDTVVVRFAHAAGGLRVRSADSVLARTGEVRGFAIAGADGRFAWATARIDDDRVLVWSPQITKPVAVRYAWGNGPVGLSLTNTLGLPAAPFRSDRR